jgi:hypothetical protein
VTPIIKTSKPKKLASKTTAAPKGAHVKPKHPTAASTKPVAAQSTPKKLLANPHPSTFPLDGISNLLDNLPLEALVELTRRLLTSISSPPTGVARPRAVLKTVILFVAEYGSTP